MIDQAWVKQQLDAAGYDVPSGERWRVRECIELLFLQLGVQKTLTHDEQLTAVEIFSRLVRGHAIADPDVQNTQGNWVQFELGDFPALTTVRVKNNAYDGVQGAKHNGMIGKLVAARGGQAIIQYANSTEGTGHRHDPNMLEALVP